MLRMPEYFHNSNEYDTLSNNGVTFTKYTINQEKFKIEISLTQHAILFVLKGKVITYCSNNIDKVILDTNSGVFLKKGNYIISFLLEDKEAIHESYLIFFNDEMISNFIQSNITLFENKILDYSQCNVFKFGQNQFIIDSINSIAAFFTNGHNYKTILLQLKIYEILINIINIDTNDTFIKILKRTITELSDLQSFMLNNYTQSMFVDDFAKKTNRSLTKFKNDFKKIFNEPPKKWINKKRLEKAYYLLCNSEMNVTDVCFLIGFTDLSYFISLFKKEYGFTPKNLQIEKISLAKDA